MRSSRTSRLGRKDCLRWRDKGQSPPQLGKNKVGRAHRSAWVSAGVGEQPDKPREWAQRPGRNLWRLPREATAGTSECVGEWRLGGEECTWRGEERFPALASRP